MSAEPVRLLYIDDDPALRRLVQRRLGTLGFEITLAADGHEGLAAAQGEDFDVIAVDHHMPGMDGLQTLERLLELPSCPPVVYVTGADDGRLAAAALRAGADDYVVKSIGEDFIELLRSAFAQSLDRVRLRRAKEQAERDLIASNERLGALLREVNHRVANNLQMTMSFINMQASVLPEGEARNALLASQQRIGAIAHVNRHLYATGNVESVALDEYLANLARDLTETWTSPHAPRTVVARRADGIADGQGGHAWHHHLRTRGKCVQVRLRRGLRGRGADHPVDQRGWPRSPDRGRRWCGVWRERRDQGHRPWAATGQGHGAWPRRLDLRAECQPRLSGQPRVRSGLTVQSPIAPSMAASA